MKTALLLASLFLTPFLVTAGEYFVEAEQFTSPGGWSVVDGLVAKQASGLKLLSGASGDPKGAAEARVAVKDAGRYRLWVRYTSHPTYRGAFRVTALSGGRVLGETAFDTTFTGKSNRDRQVWESFEITLPEGETILRLSKHENKNSSAVARLIDCLLLTMDLEREPNHLHFGAQTYARVTLGDGYDRPAYIHIFADHYHAPWYQHYSLGKAGAVGSVTAKKADFLAAGESTPWCNLTPMIYQDSGAMLFFSVRHGYTDPAPRSRATIEFATAPDAKAVVRTFAINHQPGTFTIFVPPNLVSPENIALMKSDREIAEATGKLADAHPWPTHGKKPEKFPFHVTASIERSFFHFDAEVVAREEKTLAYFGFNERPHSDIGGAWLMQGGSYCAPDTDKMREKFRRDADTFKAGGGTVKDILYCELTDEPTGQPLEFASTDASYRERFREWLRGKNLSPADLLVKSWDDVKIVTPAQRREFPALYYWSQTFRTRALGDFMATQGKIAKEIYGGEFPVLANFSDGAVYTANFYAQGVDYFELLDSPDQNAIWGEDWANGSSSYQCAAYNVDLMRAAAKDRGQLIAHHLVAHAGRKAWDIKTKATGEVARGVKILNNFCYGPVWSTHEGGPYWKSHVWQGKPDTWTANAAIVREIGAVEDLLVEAMPAPAKVALLYSSASDVWTIDETHAHGFDRMHTWMALNHAQIPVDIVHERQVAKDALAAYSVCYLSGPNLTRAAAGKLAQWVQAGGTLWLSAGAATRDEYDRPLTGFDELLPAGRGELTDLQKFQSSGRYLSTLVSKDEVAGVSVLAVSQSLAPNPGAETLATFSKGGAAIVRGPSARGTVYVCGFLPALGYIKPALDHRAALQKRIDGKAALTPGEQHEAVLIARSANPWKFPAAVRDLILAPVRSAKIVAPIRCGHALVDAVTFPHGKGILIPLANHTLEPIGRLSLSIEVPRAIARAESAVLGALPFAQRGPNTVEVSLPLDANDFLMLRFE